MNEDNTEEVLYRLYVRSGTFVCTDPQRRCYYGYMEGYIEWGEWRPWLNSNSPVNKQWAKDTVRLFSRENLQLKYEKV